MFNLKILHVLHNFVELVLHALNTKSAPLKTNITPGRGFPLQAQLPRDYFPPRNTSAKSRAT